MKSGLTLPMVLVVAVVTAPGVTAQSRRVSRQIAESVMPLPDAARAGATVLGYDSGEHLGVLREGTNVFICLADRPGDRRFRVSCYHRGLEPFMSRGRELRAQGKSMAEVRKIRKQEIEAGVLAMPERAALYTVFGTINAATGYPDSVSTLRVLYLPFATPETTGLPNRPAERGEPWLMDAGQHRAHLMIPGGARPFREPNG